ncbi:dTMP kinase [Undibacterium sp. LX40W]|uniref:Thymidylate kinase n=1 Tax=Undibacterium nitidum TaxID=2762298 RepID=A0A923HTV9_9BURK|nr:dTMP kinase [Undibacterium nitidum]MBC3879986.1 dTMP kinase [Undibacterium nitidum]MBC3891278.1 dTMP kinase [Undibacterium sp. LX40W]
MKSGKFITFEGIDGAGKSTHINFVQQLIEAQGISVIATREPGGTELGETLRSILLNQKMHLETEAMLMFASRREHLAQVIEPALAAGKWLISDRFTDASFAYQGGGRHLSIDKLNALENWVHPHLQPDLTFLFDVPISVAKARLDATRTLDKFEKEDAEFFNNTRNEYLRRAQEFPQRFRVIDSTRSIEEIRDELRDIVENLIASK